MKMSLTGLKAKQSAVGSRVRWLARGEVMEYPGNPAQVFRVFVLGHRIKGGC